MVYKILFSIALIISVCISSSWAKLEAVEQTSIEKIDLFNDEDVVNKKKSNIPQLSEYEFKDVIKKILKILIPLFENNCALTIQEYDYWMHKYPDALQKASQENYVMAFWRWGMKSLLEDINQNLELVQLISTFLAQTSNKNLEYWIRDWYHNMRQDYQFVQTGIDEEDSLPFSMILDIGLSPEQAFELKFGLRLIVLFKGLQEFFEENELCTEDYIPEKFMRAVRPIGFLELLRGLFRDVAVKGPGQKVPCIDLQPAKEFLKAYKEALEEVAQLAADEFMRRISSGQETKDVSSKITKEIFTEIFKPLLLEKTDEVFKKNNTNFMNLSTLLLPRSQSFSRKALIELLDNYADGAEMLFYQTSFSSEQSLEIYKFILYSDYLSLFEKFAEEYRLGPQDIPEDIKHYFFMFPSTIK